MEKGYSLVIDSRETSKSKKMQAFANLKNMKFVERALTAGDYALVHNDVVLRRIGFERKTVNDLLTSIYSQRLFKQARKMVNQYEIPILVVTGNMDDFQRKMEEQEIKINPNVMFGSIASMFVREGINIMWFPDDFTALEVIYRILEKISEGKWGQSRRRNKVYKSPPEILQEIEGVTSFIADKLISRFKNLANVATASKEELLATPYVKEKVALNVHMFFHTAAGSYS